jgi:hypothetical protein
MNLQEAIKTLEVNPGELHSGNGYKIYRKNQAIIAEKQFENPVTAKGEWRRIKYIPAAENWCKAEDITETDLIGALQLHKDGKANRFRFNRNKMWCKNPLMTIYCEDISLGDWQQAIIQCKMEDSDHE